MPPYGDRDMIALELYLAARAHGLPLEAPGVRR
jgi:sulfur-oxidizing protein SoxA